METFKPWVQYLMRRFPTATVVLLAATLGPLAVLLGLVEGAYEGAREGYLESRDRVSELWSLRPK